MYTVIENVRIVLSLLKSHGIKKIVISPGGSNIPIAQGAQQDPFFECYSVVDERSALYFAIGLFLESGEIVAVSCTSANATRNYIPGLTEAYYKHVPILAITMSKHPMYLGQEYMQCPIQISLPIDSVKKSYSLPRIVSDYERNQCIRTANEAILELTHHGMGPVQLNIEAIDSETWILADKQLPIVRTINRFRSSQNVSISNRKVLLIIGESRGFNNEEEQLINQFANNNNVAIYVNHISNYSGPYAINANLTIKSMTQALFDEELKPDILLSIGGITGDYDIYDKLLNSSGIEHWRISVDGDVVDTYNKLTRIYECTISSFFANIVCKENCNHDYFLKWKKYVNNIKLLEEIPFSNLYAAQRLYRKIPINSIVNFAILNSLRVWSYFPLDKSIKCYANVSSFGIDGCMSTFLGESVNTDKLCFLIIGDLSFFYDMNSIGIRHIKNNVRILLVNNNGGAEFKLRDLQYQTNVGDYISAEGHFLNAKGWAETEGYLYISAHNKDEFMAVEDMFVSNNDKPILLEIFTASEDEKQANDLIVQKNRSVANKERLRESAKDGIERVLGAKRTANIKQMIHAAK